MILDGRKIAAQWERLCHQKHARFHHHFKKRASLGVLCIGNDPASQIYVSHKQKVAARLGFECEVRHLPVHTCPQEILSLLERWDKSGLIVQLPLPAPHVASVYLGAIPPEKDVDGLNPLHKGPFVPCTPLGCGLLLKAYGIPLRGALAVVIGRSALVGRPLAEWLLNQDVTVLVAHRHTQDLGLLTRQADIICVCAGHPHLLGPTHVSAKAVVIDVGIHRTPQGLTGDLDPKAYPLVRAYSPVPGGVGPMTVMGLMWNTLSAAFLSETGQSLSLEEVLSALSPS